MNQSVETNACSHCKFWNVEFPPLIPKKVAPPVKIMFVGENPSWAKNQDEPFSDDTISGKALNDHYLKPLGLTREDVWITDIIKCRYPRGKSLDIYHYKSKCSPLIQETAEKCSNLLLVKEINEAQPKIIVTLSGKEVYQRFRKVFKLTTPIKFPDAVGKPFKIIIGGHTATLFPLIHPDISRPEGDGDNRKLIARRKWAKEHAQNHIPALKYYLGG